MVGIDYKLFFVICVILFSEAIASDESGSVQNLSELPDTFDSDKGLEVHGNDSVAALELKVARLRKELEDAERVLDAVRLTKTEIAEVVAPSPVPNTILTEALVIISGDNTSGSGFIAQIKGRTFLVTNIHVLGAARGAVFSTIGGEKLSLGSIAYLSQGRDIAIIPIEWDGGYFQLSPSLTVDDVAIGQGVTVMGNSDGASVATQLIGKISGLGPEEVEVTAKFVPGNSGSPIVHDDLGTVIAIASHLKDYSNKSKWTEDTDLSDIRRFGYRLDGEIQWEQVNLSRLYKEGEAYAKFENRTVAMWNIMYMLSYDSKLLTGYNEHPSIGYLYEDISSDFNWNRGTASANNTQMLKRFVNGMMSEVQSDLAVTEKALSVSYYRIQFEDISPYRQTILKNLKNFVHSKLN